MLLSIIFRIWVSKYTEYANLYIFLYNKKLNISRNNTVICSVIYLYFSGFWLFILEDPSML